LINESSAGRTSVDGLRLADFSAREYQPDLVLIAFGLNDARPVQPRWRRPRSWREGPTVPVEKFEANIRRAADRFRRRSGADVVLVTPCRLPGLDRTEHYRNVLISIAERNGFALADITGAWPADATPFLAPDGLHPNDSGHQIYLETLAKLGL
jgi:lysophospholipase L1-like esterase